jgi:hypothetical protein
VMGIQPRRPGLLSAAGATLGPEGRRRAAPNTHADSGSPASQGRAAVPGNKPPAGPDTHSFPAPWPFNSGGLSSSRERPVRQGSRAGRIVRRYSSSLGAAVWRGSGGPWGGASAPSPDSVRQLHADLVLSPDPPPGRRPMTGHRGQGSNRRGRRPIKASGCRDYGPGHTRADSWSSDIGMSSLWLAPSAPVRPRLAGRPGTQCLTKRLTSKTSFVCSMW